MQNRKAKLSGCVGEMATLSLQQTVNKMKNVRNCCTIACIVRMILSDSPMQYYATACIIR